MRCESCVHFDLTGKCLLASEKPRPNLANEDGFCRVIQSAGYLLSDSHPVNLEILIGYISSCHDRCTQKQTSPSSDKLLLRFYLEALERFQDPSTKGTWEDFRQTPFALSVLPVGKIICFGNQLEALDEFVLRGVTNQTRLSVRSSSYSLSQFISNKLAHNRFNGKVDDIESWRTQQDPTWVKQKPDENEPTYSCSTITSVQRYSTGKGRVGNPLLFQTYVYYKTHPEWPHKIMRGEQHRLLNSAEANQATEELRAMSALHSLAAQVEKLERINKAKPD